MLRTDFTCSLVRKPLSSSSRSAPNPTPSIPPAKIVDSQIFIVCGPVCVNEADEIKRASLIG